MKSILNSSRNGDCEPSTIFNIFRNNYQLYFTTFTDAPAKTPSVEDLYNQAQRARPRVSAGIDGWLPWELKALPVAAWEERTKVINSAIKLEQFPVDYKTVTSPCLPKKHPGNKPLDHRLLAVFSALYHV